MTISKLKPLKNGAIDNSDPLHRVRKLSPLNLKRI